MASIFKKTGSPYWQIKYLADDDAWRNLSSKIRINAGREGKRKAQELAQQYSRKESPSARARCSERWERWVFDYFDRKYGAEEPKNPKLTTRIRARAAWTAISDFLEEKKVRTPRQLTYTIAACFIEWRTAEHTGARTIHHNTAVVELRFLSSVMREAVRRGMADANCVREVQARRIAGKQKDCLTPEQIAAVESRLALDETPQWMREHWLVLTRQGCRCSEAFAPMHQVSETTGTIRLRLKGGKIFTAPLHAELLPLVEKARKERRAHLIAPQKNAPKLWWNFFRECGVNASIHWVRVTVITRMLLGNYTTAQVCAYIGHSEEVNRVYQKIKPHQIVPPKW